MLQVNGLVMGILNYTILGLSHFNSSATVRFPAWGG